MELKTTPPVGLLRRSVSTPTTPLNSKANSRRTGPPAGSRAALLVTAIAIVLTLGVATYGVETNRKTIAILGLAATVVIAALMVAGARHSIRARDDLRVANDQLRRENAGLRTRELAVAQGFDLVDERTQGRLRELVEETGAELAEIVDEALDRPGSGA